jgi:hypothetical protein
MMVIATSIAVIVGGLLLPVLSAQDAPKTWTNVMYLGGAVGVRGKSMVWDNVLTISAQTIKLERKKSGTIFELQTSSVHGLSYSDKKHVNEGALMAGAATAGLLGMLVGSAFKSTDYYAVLEYTLPDKTKAAVLLRLHKDNYQVIIDALRKATNLE